MTLPDAIKQEDLQKHFQPLTLLDWHPPKPPSDIEERVHRNAGSRKAKEPVSVMANRWIDQHPQVYAKFCEYALMVISRGRTRYGAKALIEQIRWNVEIVGGKPFKLPNAVTTYLARRFQHDYPAHASLFNTVRK